MKSTATEKIQEMGVQVSLAAGDGDSRQWRSDDVTCGPVRAPCGAARDPLACMDSGLHVGPLAAAGWSLRQPVVRRG